LHPRPHRKCSPVKAPRGKGTCGSDPVQCHENPRTAAKSIEHASMFSPRIGVFADNPFAESVALGSTRPAGGMADEGSLLLEETLEPALGLVDREMLGNLRSVGKQERTHGRIVAMKPDPREVNRRGTLRVRLDRWVRLLS
jgi:hypothetical protein